MQLTPTIDSVSALFRKLERENYRALHSRNAIHRADHFMNFCLTAHAIQDHLLEHLNLIGPPGSVESSNTAKSFRERWSENPSIQAAADIANTTKHFVLREQKKKTVRVAPTKGVRRGRSTYVDIFEMQDGTLTANPVSVPDYFVKLSDGTTQELYVFTESVLAFWKSELRQNGVRIRRQAFKSLSGHP